MLDKKVRKDSLLRRHLSRSLSKGREKQPIQKFGGSWLQTKGSTKALRSFSLPQRTAKKSVWPGKGRQRTIRHDVK